MKNIEGIINDKFSGTPWYAEKDRTKPYTHIIYSRCGIKIAEVCGMSGLVTGLDYMRIKLILQAVNGGFNPNEDII